MACEDPSSVGLGLVGDESGQPVTAAIDMATFETSDDTGIIDNNGEVFVGTVNDPTFGATQATGYLDFQTGASVPANYRNGTVEQVILRLEPSYMYGDTLEQMTIAVHESLREFTGSGSTQDSIPEVGPELFRFDMMPTDSLVDVTLPDSWVTSRDADLRSTSFATLFQGFQLVPVSGNTVVSFLNNSGGESSILGIAGTDTVQYRAIKSISQFEKMTEGTVPANRLPFQSGVGPKITLNFDFSEFQGVALNRISVRILRDSLAADTPANFFRPEPESIALFGLAENAEPALLAVATVDNEGFYDFSSEIFHGLFQQFLLGSTPYDEYELQFAGSSISSMNSLLLHDINSTDKPAVFITYTRLD